MFSRGYTFFETNDTIATNSNFFLHCHDEYEIFMFLGGDSSYVVEGNVYSLSPGDVIIIRKHQMHRIYHNSPKTYKRIAIQISPAFFQSMSCNEYEKVFLQAGKKNLGNKLNSEIVRSSGLYDAIMRLKKYSNKFTEKSPITDAIVTEILYILNNTAQFSIADMSNQQLKEIIGYINSHFTENITLDGISEQFFLSKYYLCRQFKKYTGLTLQSYIRQKRLALVQELYAAGKSLADSAVSAGFSDYSSFYRTYLNEYGISPKKGM